MSIRDIIEAATPGPWDVIPHRATRTLVMSPEGMDPLAVIGGDNHRRDATFIATFDPEHVALMEEVNDLAMHGYGGTELDFGEWKTKFYAAVAALNAYRKGRGLL